uniref:Uncharacterized protein n=1 Tax=Rhizophora mucronata TaxID=61149 RepID=A0A2P2QQ36_RHIMU
MESSSPLLWNTTARRCHTIFHALSPSTSTKSRSPPSFPSSLSPRNSPYRLLSRCCRRIRARTSLKNSILASLQLL